MPVINRAIFILNDEERRFWKDEELLAYQKEGAALMAKAAPSLFATVKTITLKAGGQQSMASPDFGCPETITVNGQRLIRIDKQTGESYKALCNIGKEQFFWCTGDGKFEIYPPLSADTTASAEISSVPVDGNVPAFLEPALLDYILHRAYQREGIHAQKVGEHWNLFTQKLQLAVGSNG